MASSSEHSLLECKALLRAQQLRQGHLELDL
jgi:hypothetical protein